MLLHHYESGAPQQIVAVGVHPFARPQDLLRRLAVPASMGGGVTVSTLPNLSRDASAELAVEVVEEVPVPLLVLF